MGFLDPKSTDDEDDALPGASGLYLDLDLKRCPSCRRELTPWQERCEDCGEVGVAASQVRASTFALPDLSHLDVDDADDETDETDTRAAGASGRRPDEDEDEG
jgi:hypothetical protein